MTGNLFYRDALVEADQPGIATGTIRVSFASEYPVMRRDKKGGVYWEVLSLQPGDVNLGIINTSGIVLCDHNEREEIGTVVKGSVRVEGDMKARATIQITDPKWSNRIQAGERPGVSVGYTLLSVVNRYLGKDNVEVREYAWQPTEISLLNEEPADPTVGLWRSQLMNDLEIGDLLKIALSGSRRGEDNHLTRAALTENYSLRKLLLGGRELDAMHRRVNESPRGLPERFANDFIRWECLLPQKRDLTTGVFGQGGAMVQTDAHPFVEIFFNQLTALPLGANVVTGLTGNFFAPRVTSAVTVQPLSETALATSSNPTLDQVGYGPRRLHVQVNISQKLLHQTGGGVEDLIRAHVRNAIAEKMDQQILYGQGAASEPLGILNTPGVNAVLYGGAATWPNVLASETALANSNADHGKLGWAISTATRNKWKNASRIAGSNFPSFLMEGGEVNDYPAIATTTLSNDNQTVFGNWDDLYVLIWGNGVEILIDPFSQAVNGEVVFHCELWWNLCVQHPQSFCVSTDSGAQ